MGIAAFIAVGAAGLLANRLMMGLPLPTSVQVLLFVFALGISGFIFRFILLQFEIERLRPSFREFLNEQEHI